MKRIICDIDPRLVAHRSDVIVDRALYHLAYVVPLASDPSKRDDRRRRVSDAART